MFAFYAVLSYKILIQTRRSCTPHLIAHVEDKFVPNVLFDTVINCCVQRHISGPFLILDLSPGL